MLQLFSMHTCNTVASTIFTCTNYISSIRCEPDKLQTNIERKPIDNIYLQYIGS